MGVDLNGERLWVAIGARDGAGGEQMAAR